MDSTIMRVIEHSRLNRAFRRATGGLRGLPDILIIGAMRSGTGSLWKWFSRHPEVKTPSRKEIQFFDFYFHRGVNWYRAFFPLGKAHATIDVSPSYMTNLHAAERAVQVVPHARVVAVLRDPVERVFSQYRLRVRTGTETRSLYEVISAELESNPGPMDTFPNSAAIPYLTGGLYAAQLEPWIEAFGRSSVMVVDAERMFENPETTLADLLSFLELGSSVQSLPHRNVGAQISDPEPSLRASLEAFYREPNDALEELLGDSFCW